MHWFSAPEVCRRYGFSRSTLHRLVTAGRFPPPVNISPRRVAWAGSVLDAQDKHLVRGRP
ncbi:AlpA family phage regulatory protein [Rivibacter subsaxonicus]